MHSSLRSRRSRRIKSTVLHKVRPLAFAAFVTVAIAGLVVGFFIRKETKAALNMKVWDRVLRDQPVKINPEGAKNPGNPNEAVQRLRRIYHVMNSYREKHNGLPSLGELLGSGSKPGLIAQEDQVLPDQEFKDGLPDPSKNDCFTWAYRSPRPNGQPKPAFPSTGEKDVWVYTDLYIRRNQTIMPDGHSEFEPRGVYVVLWSDGTIEKVPMQDAVLIGEGLSSTYSFAGQAGNPKKTETWGERARNEELTVVR